MLLPFTIARTLTFGEKKMPRVPVPDTLPEPIDVRLLPYWAAVRQYRQSGDTLPAQYFWLYIESCESEVNGIAVADISELIARQERAGA
jgi:hypothetical protein